MAVSVKDDCGWKVSNGTVFKININSSLSKYIVIESKKRTCLSDQALEERVITM